MLFPELVRPKFQELFVPVFTVKLQANKTNVLAFRFDSPRVLKYRAGLLLVNWYYQLSKNKSSQQDSGENHVIRITRAAGICPHSVGRNSASRPAMARRNCHRRCLSRDGRTCLYRLVHDPEPNVRLVAAGAGHDDV